MNHSLFLLRKSHKLAKDQVAAQLNTTVDDYSKLETGENKLSLEQAKLLSELYNIDPKHLLANDNSVVNYNIGTYSRAIINAENYYEGKEGE